MKAHKQIVFMLLLSVILVSCGGKEKQKEGFTYEKKTDVVSDTADATINAVTITANDMMKFDKSEIRVKAGKMVKLTLKFDGKLDKHVMGHNFVLLKQGVDVAAFGNKSATARDTEYIPADELNNIIAHTKLIGGGESDTIEFEAPAVGTYDFLCSFPGHYAIMKGKFIVE